jgi:SAM-dependent methyltransferase
VPVLDLGTVPLADELVPPGLPVEDEHSYPLTVVFCPRCSLVQIKETVPPTVLYDEDYPYFSSFSDELLDHSRTHAEGLVDELGLGGDNLVVELASNDGYLLQWFLKAGVPVLGIDPAPGPAIVAEERGIPTIKDFFTPDLAHRLVADGVRADVVLGNNVLAHVPDQNRFVAGIAEILAPSGRVEIEVPYVRDMVDHCEFDTIYHEHHCYFSVTALAALFGRHGLDLIRVRRFPIHGGSLRVTFSAGAEAEPSVEEYLEEERRIGLTGPGYYAAFSDRVERVREDLIALLSGLTSEGASIAAYGAAAKGTTLLNFTGAAEYLDYVVDRNTHKHGMQMPGVRLPIFPPDRLLDDQPDYLLILAWNFGDEIMRQQAEYAARGGRFIVPVPQPTIL